LSEELLQEAKIQREDALKRAEEAEKALIEERNAKLELDFNAKY